MTSVPPLRWLQRSAARRAGFFVVLLGMCCLPLSYLTAQAAEPAAEKQAFDVPGGDAWPMLRLFARQANREIVFPIDDVAEVKTRAAKGEFTIPEALRQMLADTGLLASFDARTGAIAIRKQAPPPRAEARLSAKPPQSRKTLPPNTMKPTHVLTRLAAIVALAVTATTKAQTPPEGTAIIQGRVLNEAKGEYMENARITISGSALEVFTDRFGQYRIERVPAGTVEVLAFYTGYGVQKQTVAVAAGATVVQDFTFTGLAVPASKGGAEVITLDALTVTAARDMDAAAIAINEQRYAPNIRKVVSTDEFGAIAEGNVAEFLRFLPGVAIDMVGGDARTVSINGAPAANTPITIGGFNLPNPGNNSTGRAVEVGFFILNNISRVEVAYSPTPDSPGAALAGSVNMIPRSAFERSKPQIRGSVYYLMRDDAKDFGKTASQYHDARSTVHPGFDFSWIMPVNKRFGFTVAAGHSTQYSYQDGTSTTWRGANAATNGTTFPHTTFDKPYLSAYSWYWAPKETRRSSLGFTLDYKLGEHDTLTGSFQYASFAGWTSTYTQGFSPGGILGSSISTNSVVSTPASGTVTLNASNGRVRDYATYMPSFTWRHSGPVWRLEGAWSRGFGKNSYRDQEKGMMLAVNTRRRAVTIGFAEAGFLRPNVITVSDGAGAPVDYTTLASYELASVTSTPRYAEDINTTAYTSASRMFDWKVPVMIKTGLNFNQLRRDNRAISYSWSYLGADGLGATTIGSAAPFADALISSRSGFAWGFPRMQFPDLKGTYDYFKANPGHFLLDDNTLHRSNINNSKLAKEAVSSAYLRADVDLLGNRLKLIGGVRAEQTNIWAEGPLTDPSRNVQRDARGNPILGPNGSPLPITSVPLEVARLTMFDRGAQVEKEYLRWFPSLNARYEIQQNLIARASVSTSIGRPDYNQYAGGITLPNTDSPPSPTNRIAVNNAGIKPWKAVSYGARVEYYFGGVGQVSLGATQREFTNFFGSTVFLPAAEFLALYGLDANEYGNYEVATQFNRPEKIKLQTVDFDYKQALTFLPAWARGFQLFANASFNKVDGTTKGVLGARGFNEYPKAASWGISYSRSRYSLRANWSYRDATVRGLVTGTGIEAETYNYTPEQTRLDLLAEYTFYKSFVLFGKFSNVTDVPDSAEVYGPSTPAVARMSFTERYGSLWQIGVRAQF